MISYLEGKILEKNDKFFLIGAAGVGYKVFSRGGIIGELPEAGQNAAVWTHLCVREDAMDLYGFIEKEELEFFENLISISGIGPKSALGILEAAPVSILKQAIVSEDEKFFTQVSGIGKKTAQRLILELKNKLATTTPADKSGDFRETGDAFEALSALGYRQGDVRRALNDLPETAKTVEEKVKEALKRLSRQ